MKTINLEKIITAHKLSKPEMANLLFPDNKFPQLALNRIISGDAVLDANQISRLASYLDTSIDNLFSGLNWNITSDHVSVILKTGEYTAKVNKSTNVTRIFHNDSLFFEERLFSGSISVVNFLTKIDKIIEDHLNK